MASASAPAARSINLLSIPVLPTSSGEPAQTEPTRECAAPTAMRQGQSAAPFTHCGFAPGQYGIAIEAVGVRGPPEPTFKRIGSEVITACDKLPRRGQRHLGRPRNQVREASKSATL